MEKERLFHNFVRNVSYEVQDYGHQKSVTL